MSPVSQRDGIGAGVWIGERRQLHFAPRLPTIIGPNLEQPPLLRAANRLQLAISVPQDAGLNRADCSPVVERLGCAPGLAAVARPLKMDAPAIVFAACG